MAVVVICSIKIGSCDWGCDLVVLGIAGPDRRIYLPEGLLDKSEIPSYLNGEVPGE